MELMNICADIAFDEWGGDAGLGVGAGKSSTKKGKGKGKAKGKGKVFNHHSSTLSSRYAEV